MTEQRQHTDTETEIVDFIHAIDVTAPPELHGRVEAMIAQRAGSAAGARRRSPLLRRPALVASLAGAVALVVAVALAADLGGGGSSSPPLTAAQATALTLRAATAPAPGESASDGAQLDASVEGTAFPYWKEQFGWRATGARVDHVGGRTVRTVFYGNASGQRVGYAIVSGKHAPHVGAGQVAWRGQTPYSISAHGDVRVVTWLRSGHLCVIAGRDVSAATLVALASWDDRAAIA